MEKNTMDNYVVRIYRRDTKNPGLLVGVVEEVGVEGNRAFHNLDELWAILISGNRLSAWKKGDKHPKRGEKRSNKRANL
ncbi:MAG: hypothetical protein HZA12_03315 [Nitrospirae bacterium]|nr:hypothetical protein [Nitrospirota bacterium]